MAVVLRALLLWVVVPLGVVAWLVALPWRLVRRRATSPRPYVVWLDAVVQHALASTVARPARLGTSWPSWPPDAATMRRFSFADLFDAPDL